MGAKFLISHASVTLNDDLGHPNCYDNVEYRSLSSY